MANNVTAEFDPRMFTTHGVKKKQGKWIRANNRVAFAYYEGEGAGERILGYTFYEEMIPILTSDALPEYQLDF